MEINLPVASFPTVLGGCPNSFPTIDGGVAYRIALIGEAPGADEIVAHRPFVGVSGRWLDYLLNRVGILRSACFLGNVCQVRPPANDIDRFEWNGPEIQEGLELLKKDIHEFDPYLCVCLGNSALRAAKGYAESISKWRGSLFTGASGTAVEGRKCISTYHPASALRVYEQTPLLLFDLKRARRQGEGRNLSLPVRSIKVLRTLGEVQLELSRLRNNRRKIGTDIEGYVNNMTCISFADDPLCGYVIPFVGPGGSFWREDEELVVWTCVKELLEDPLVPKVLQNGLYDRFVLAYTYGISIRGVSDDTMVKHWEAYCELPKALSLQASIYTLEQYYKDERTSDDWEEFWQYSGKDSCVTLEISNHQDTMIELAGAAGQHYKFNVEMQNPLLYMELRGMNYDQQQARTIADRIKGEVFLLQHELNKVNDCQLSITSPEVALSYMRDVFCIKKASGLVFRPEDCIHYARKAFLDDGSIHRAIQLCSQGYPFDASRNGEFSRLVGVAVNTDSPKQLQQFLYITLGLPPQINKKTDKVTTDALALLKLFKKTGNPVLKTILRLSSLLTQLQTLEILCDEDGRIRCAYNIVGTKTGRLSCSKSPTRSGYNLQTVTKRQRGLFKPDAEHLLFQCDLSGADGYTVAAHCKRLGDPTMLDDLLFGLRPAKIIARMYEGLNVARLTREQIAEECKKIDSKGWLYMASKRVYHGGNYLMGKITMSDQILEDSWKYGDDIVYVAPATCEDLKMLVFQRYPGTQVWHRWMQEQLKSKRSLTSANGHTRRFFGRPNDHDTLKEALADEPQNNTTYATNLAMLRLWNDPDNRRQDGSLIIEPLHQVHDAIVGQFPMGSVEWAVYKIREYFNNTLTIAGEPIVIPFEGAYGASWSPEDLINPI